MVGQNISHYRIIRKIGQGGMGVVYEAEDLKLERRVALKFLSPHRTQDDENRRRFMREARSAAALNHTNICAVYEIDEAGGELFIAMEYCEGLPLHELIRQAPLDPSAAISIVIQVADALGEAHGRHIIHRDLKSSNIMVDAKNRVRLLDFGLASLVDSGDVTATLDFMGTPAYMAPERIELGISDARGDIWGLGVVIYESFSGQMPFAGDLRRLLHSILNDRPPGLSSLRAGLPAELDEIVEKALAKNPADRYQNVHDVAADLIVIQREWKHEEMPGKAAANAGVPRARLAVAASSKTERAVAVLPFVNMSHKAEDDFLSDAVTEEITNALTQVLGLRVVSRASAFQFKSPSLDLREVARRLGAGALVLGSVRRQAKRIRVTAQLVNPTNGYQIWSRRFDGDMKGVFDIEDQVTGAIVEHLRQWHGTDLEIARLGGGTRDFTAHELYLRGRYSFNLQTERGFVDALNFFSQALDLSPRYALARVGMADCYAAQGWYGLERPTKVMPKAKAELDAAIAIEEALPSAWCLRAAITAGFDWDWEVARAEFQKAFSLGSWTSDLHFHHALDFLTPLQRLDEALEETKLALELDPAAPLMSTAVGGCLYRMRRYPAALRQLQSTLALAPDFYHAHWTMARVYQSLGLFPQALECFERALAPSANNPAVLADAGHCRGSMGDAAGARQILKRVAGVPLAGAIVHLGLKESEAAIEHLKEALEERARGLIWLGVDPRFDVIGENPAFREIMSAVGLGEFHKVDGEHSASCA